MRTITPRQLELLSFLNLIVNTRGFMPTFEEMKHQMGVSSKDTIFCFLKGLVEKGYLEKKNKGYKDRYIITEKGKIEEKVFRLCPMCGNLVSHAPPIRG